MYKLENQIYYHIKVPLFNNFKDSSGHIISAKACMDAFAIEQKTNSHDEAFDSFKSRFTRDEIDSKWCEENAGKLCHMQNLIKKLKQCSDSDFYSNAVLFGYGVVSHEWQSLHMNHHRISEISSYIFGFPASSFFDGLKVFEDGGYQYFIKYIPSVFTTWPYICENASPAETVRYTDNACVLFEFILHRSAFSYFSLTTPEHKAALKNAILCYYKWLKGKNIYLPKQLQEMIYNFPYIY